MLRSLTVENYVLIEHLEMDFGPRLNIITGETGAGKSILLGALGLLLGTRGESGVLGDPQKNCVVEGVFEVEGLEHFFAENDIEFAPLTTVRRVILAGGKSKAFVNDLPVTIAVLRELGERLIDVHSQHENLLLKGDAFRTSIVDVAAGQGESVGRYGEIFSHWRGLSRQLEERRESFAAARRDEDYVRHQFAELAALKLRAGEQQELEAEQQQLAHADEIREALGLCVDELSADDGGILGRVKFMRQAVERVQNIHPSAKEFSDRLNSVYLELHDLEREMSGECERVEGNPERLDTVNRRLDAIWSLERKHRVDSVEELLALQEQLDAQLQAIDNSDEELKRLEGEVATVHREVRALAEKISEGRKKAAAVVAAHVENTLKELGMAGAKFVVEVCPVDDLRPNGADEVRFLFASGSSSTPRPVEKIASGGEISRVMLALKTLSARVKGQPTVVFDEIDAGVSGRVADAMGRVIGELAQSCQVVNITHLPQIAAGKGEHFVVYKEGGSTKIKPLSGDERVAEIAKMLSGNTVTDAAVKQARELLSSTPPLS